MKKNFAKAKLNNLVKKLLIIIFSVLFILILSQTIRIIYFQDKHSSTKIYDRKGVLLYEAQIPEKGYTNYVDYEEINPLFFEVFVEIEDRYFYSNLGVDIPRNIKCMSNIFLEDRNVCGASTITQQYIKFSLNNRNRNIPNKVEEFLVAPIISILLPKNEIMTRYLNTIYFSNMRYGVESASRGYFGKPNTELDLAQVTYLSAIPNSPLYLDPYKNHEDVKKRQKLILDILVSRGRIEKVEADAAYSEEIILKNNSDNIIAPHFVMMFDKEILEKEEIHSTIDATLYKDTLSIVQAELEKIKNENASNAGVVVLDAKTGEILSLVGSKDFFDYENEGQVNSVLSLRNPGSTLKPFTYGVSFADNFSAGTLIEDKKQIIHDSDGSQYFPQNYDGGEHGFVSVRDALANSYNIPAVMTLKTIGVEKLHIIADQIGLEELRSQNTDIAVTLGGCSISLLDLVNAYRIFPNEGNYLGDPVIQLNTKEDKQTPKIFGEYSQEISYIISDILSDNDARRPSFGSLSALSLPFKTSAKTGTSMDFKDSWTIGYTNDYVVGVWVGNNDNSPMRGVSGIQGAAEIWNSVMLVTQQYYNENFPEKINFVQRPQRVSKIDICSTTGEIFTRNCEGYQRQELFIEGKTPDNPDIRKRLNVLEPDSIAIIDPWDNDTYLIEDSDFVSIPIEFISNSEFDKYILVVDGKDILETQKLGKIFWESQLGSHILQIDGLKGEKRVFGDSITVNIER